MNIFVFAGDDHQAHHWKQENIQRDARTIHRHALHVLQGCSGATVVLYGTYYERPDYPELRDYARVLDLKLLSEAAFSEAEKARCTAAIFSGVPVRYDSRLRPGTIIMLDKDKPTAYIVADSAETLQYALCVANQKPAKISEQKKPKTWPFA